MNKHEYRRCNDNNRQKRRPGFSFSIKASLILCLLVLFFAGLNSITVNAGTDSNKTQETVAATKIYTTYKVQAGDNLKSIAKEYCNLDHYDSYEDYILEVCNINHISSDKIYAGYNISLPLYI